MVAACHASAPNMAKASRCSQLFFFTPFPPLDKHLACYMLLPSVTSDLLNLIIIDISSKIINTRAVGRRRARWSRRDPRTCRTQLLARRGANSRPPGTTRSALKHQISNRSETPAERIVCIHAQIQLPCVVAPRLPQSQLADQNEEPGNQKTQG